MKNLDFNSSLNDFNIVWNYKNKNKNYINKIYVRICALLICGFQMIMFKISFQIHNIISVFLSAKSSNFTSWYVIKLYHTIYTSNCSPNFLILNLKSKATYKILNKINLTPKYQRNRRNWYAYNNSIKTWIKVIIAYKTIYHLQCHLL